MARTNSLLLMAIVFIGIVILISLTSIQVSGKGPRIEADVAQINYQLDSIVSTTQGVNIAKTVPAKTVTKEVTLTRPTDPCAPAWTIIGEEIGNSRTILVDLSHGERIRIDNATSSYLNFTKNPRVFDWQAWAEDMRAHGYTVKLIRTRPITETTLLNSDLLIIAEPDSDASGPLYFTKDEAAVIGNYVRRGNGLLLMGQQFMGGETVQQYISDYKGTYVYDIILNTLLSDLNLPMRFTNGKTGSDPHDLMVSTDAATMVQGSIADIWIGTGTIFTSPSIHFAAFHANSIIPNGASEIAKGDKNVYTTPKNLKFSPVLKPKGSMPVLIAASSLECGYVIIYGDPSSWQTRNYKGEIFRNSLYQEQVVAHEIIKALTDLRQICGYTVPAGCLAVNNTTQVNVTPSVTTPRVTRVTPITTRPGCEDCLSQCRRIINPAERPICFASCSRTYGEECTFQTQQTCPPCITPCSNPSTAAECTACFEQYCSEPETPTCTTCATDCNFDMDCMQQTCPNCIGTMTCNTCIGYCHNDPECMRSICAECIQETTDNCEDCPTICADASDIYACEKNCDNENRLNDCPQDSCGDCWNTCSGLADPSLRQECRSMCELANSCTDETCNTCQSRCNDIVNLDERAACNELCIEEVCQERLISAVLTPVPTGGVSGTATGTRSITTYIPGVQNGGTTTPVVTLPVITLHTLPVYAPVYTSSSKPTGSSGGLITTFSFKPFSPQIKPTK